MYRYRLATSYGAVCSLLLSFSFLAIPLAVPKLFFSQFPNLCWCHLHLLSLTNLPG